MRNRKLIKYFAVPLMLCAMVAFMIAQSTETRINGNLTIGNNLTVGGTITQSGLTANTMIYSNASKVIVSTAAPTNGQFLIGSTGAAPALATLTGTANQLTVTNGAASVTLTIPSAFILPGSVDVSNASVNSNSQTGDSFVFTNEGLLETTANATNGQLLIGSTGVSPVAATLTGTANQVVVTNGAGSITLSTPQSIHTGATPTFASLTLSGLTANSFLFSGTAGLLTTTAAPTNGQLLIGSTGAAPVAAALTGTANRVTVTNGAGTITLNGPQDLHTAASPIFSGLTVTAATISGLTANSFMYPGAAGTLASTAAATNGQLLIGSTGVVPVAATLTGTANQVVVTNGAGSITLSTPQSIHTGATPTFTSLTLSGLTANSFAYSGAAGLLSTTAAPTNGQLLIGSTGAAPVAAALTGTANQVVVTNGAGTITLSAPQNIHTGASPTFVGLVATGKYNSTPQSATCPDSGDGSPGVLTLQPTASIVNITNSDANGCTLTMSETGAVAGDLVTIIIVSNAGTTVNFADTAGVSELAGAFSADINDVLDLVYTNATWVERGRSAN